MKKTFLGILLVLLASLAACSGGGAESDSAMTVENVWGRNSPMAAPNGAFYMIITNNTGQDDSLTGAAVDVCGTVELHEMYMKENDVMGMRQVEGGVIPIPNGETVELKVGGLHVMCIGKTKEFELGEKFPITLSFANAGDIVVEAEIREEAMDSGMDMGG
jgi:periplasmic copper chaperone A